MNLEDGTIVLQPFEDENTNDARKHQLYAAWNQLTHRSAEAIQEGIVGLYDFLDCEKRLYLASIDCRLPQELPEGVHPNDTATSSEPPLMPIGIIYITSTDLPSTVNIGLSIIPSSWGNGHGARAMRLLVAWTFQELRVHRVQTRVINFEDDGSDVAHQLFNSLGFAYEGTSRRALFCPQVLDGNLEAAPTSPGNTNGVWRDVTTYAMLDTDWSLQQAARRNTGMKSMWDAMFARHEIESESLLRLEERVEHRRHTLRMAAQAQIHASADPVTSTSYVPPTKLSDVNAFASHKADIQIWESTNPGRVTPTRSTLDSPAPSQSQSLPYSEGHTAPEPIASSSTPARAQFNRPPWWEVFNAPHDDESSEPNTPYESADEIDEDTASTVSSFSSLSVEREILSEGELVSDVESVISIPSRPPSVASDASASSWFDPWGDSERERENARNEAAE